jgi:hypothetical protein
VLRDVSLPKADNCMRHGNQSPGDG